MTFKSTPELDIDVRRICDVLDAAAPGDVVTYATLSAAIGRDVQGDARSVLYRALRRQLKDSDRLWLCLREKGYRLATDSEIATGVPEESRLKVSRLAKRQGRKLAAIQDLDALSREEKTGVLAAQSFLGVINAFTKPAAVKKLETKINDSGETKALPLAKTIEMFSK
jgi:alkylated DNA nucleotide flippase Atl1